MSAATEAIAATRAKGRTADAETGKKTAKPEKAPRQSLPATDIRVGAEPRVDLLPAEIRTARKHEKIVRRMVVGLVVTVAVVVAAVLGAAAYALTAGVAATAEQNRSDALIRQQAQYGPLRTAQSEAALVKAAQSVGGATDIDWSALGDSLLKSLPAGAAITNVSIDAASPLVPYQQSLVPGSPTRVATATVTISAPDLTTVTQWLSTLGSLPNVVDSSAGAITVQSTGYQAIATIHYGSTAWDNKYLPKTGGK
ncbi:hypothetical protein [Leifsonia shinshuensis]|uniref:PilN domain-containing protein n=1 Tax=Leifsonia shinshuensis TaxID=150026 RepID=A0A7G6YEZ2_9MICO|nr:hypothetical protein [Leifsonia shinshuensis]QNE37057.1 hypothetical protein F1C12_19370 [Leifsonia shinshuensis]